MEISVYKPSKPSLSSFIKYFYILRQSASDAEFTYLTFPNTNSMLTITNRVDVRHSPNRVEISPTNDEGLISDLTMAYNKPLLINYTGKVKEITICFKPLGIHSFDANLKNALEPEVAYCPYADYKQCMGEILKLEDNDKMIAGMEAYLLSKKVAFTHPFLCDFVGDVDENPTTSLDSLSTKYGISQKTLIKHSKLFFHRTPSEYKRIVRFHNAMSKYMSSEKKSGALTDISYTAQFFDQAHMIKDFRALTGYTPTDFFKNLNPVKGEFNWMFL